MVVVVKQTSEVGMMNALLGKLEMHRLVVAGAEAVRKLLGYCKQSAELAVAILQMMCVALTEMHA